MLEPDTYTAQSIYCTLLLNFQLSTSVALEAHFSTSCTKYSVITSILQGRQQLEGK